MLQFGAGSEKMAHFGGGFGRSVRRVRNPVSYWFRFTFLQDIITPAGLPVLQARVTGTVVDPAGRPVMPLEVDELIPMEKR